MSHTVRNMKRRQRVINLPGRGGALYLGPMGRALLTDDQFNSEEVQQLIRGGFLVEEGRNG